MALTVKQLNSDTSFLLSFEPVIPESAGDPTVPRPFTVLLDPWLAGPSSTLHSKLSTATHKQPPCISSLSELAQPPNLVIISQSKSDHCNETTLRQLPSSGTNTLILAEPASARLIRSWKYFDPSKIITIERWEDPRLTGKKSVVRIPVPSAQPGGRQGEVTVAFIPQKRDFTGLHSAIGLTYRPPPHGPINKGGEAKLPTPPSTPESNTQNFAGSSLLETRSSRDTFLLPPSPPISPTSLRSVRSVSTLVTSPTQSVYNPSFRPLTSCQNERGLSIGTYGHTRPISLIYSPHGMPYTGPLRDYVTSHLVAEAALPLSALLHCMDSVDNPWWLGGNVSSGVPHGAETAAKLGARLWISAHDGDKDTRGFTAGMMKTRRWKHEEILAALEAKGLRALTPTRGSESDKTRRSQKAGGTEVMRLTSGEEVLVSATGVVWRTATTIDDRSTIKTSTETDNHPTVRKSMEVAPTTPRPFLTEKRSMTSVRDPDKKPGFPRVQSGMLPKKLGIYKALKTIDIMMPSPKLVLDREISTAKERPPAEVSFTAPGPPPEVTSKKAAETLGIDPAILQAVIVNDNDVDDEPAEKPDLPV